MIVAPRKTLRPHKVCFFAPLFSWIKLLCEEILSSNSVTLGAPSDLPFTYLMLKKRSISKRFASAAEQCFFFASVSFVYLMGAAVWDEIENESLIYNHNWNFGVIDFFVWKLIPALAIFFLVWRLMITFNLSRELAGVSST